MRYSLLAEGKRVCPVLAFATALHELSAAIRVDGSSAANTSASHHLLTWRPALDRHQCGRGVDQAVLGPSKAVSDTSPELHVSCFPVVP